MTARKLTNKAIIDNLDLSSKTLTLPGYNVPSGNIGIGTLSPDSRLEISGSGNQQLKVTKSDDGVETVLLSQEGEGWIGTQSNHPLKFGTNYIAKMYLTTDGDFGIGTFTPTEKLHVDGTTRFDDITYIGGKPSQSLGVLNVQQVSNADNQGIAIWDSSNARTMRLWVDSTDSYVYSAGTGDSPLNINGANGLTRIPGSLQANGSFRLPSFTTEPTGAEGQIYYDTTNKQVKFHNGTEWNPINESPLLVSTFDAFGDGSCVGLWQMDGNGIDTGGSYNFSGNTASSNFTTGKFGQAFNGTGSNQMTYTGWQPSSAHSVSFWYKSSTQGQANKRVVTVKGTSASAGFNNNAGSLGFYTGGGTTTTANVTRVRNIPDATVNDGNWHHIVYTISSSSSWTLYVDGAEWTDTANDGEGRSFNSGNDIAITTYDGGTGYNSICNIDQLRIFNRIITADEVSSLYNVIG